MKEKACKVCGTVFTPLRSMQKVCGAPCAIHHAIHVRDKNRAKAERVAKLESRKVIQLAKEKAKRRSDWQKEAQAAFNAWVRLRDDKLPCISCGRHHQGQYHAGHYRSVGSNPALRFEPLNVHKQCAPCNNHKSGNLVEYRINLLKKIGSGSLDWLEGPHEPKKYTIDELKEIKRHYTDLRKQLMKGVANG